MRFINLKKTIVASALGLVALLGTSEVTNAQNRRDRDDQRRERRDDDRRWDQNRNDGWRVYRNGRYYDTDNRGAELLREAVRQGYQQGFREGQFDRSNRRRGNYYGNSIYRSGNYGYQRYVDSAQYRYYFQQGFQRGYEDGFNSRYRYGTYRNGVANILGNVLANILNLRQY